MSAQKHVLITGCSPGGIGHALAMEFHSRGLNVLATNRNPATMADLAEKGIHTLALDVTKPESIKACHAEVAGITGGKLDMLVNNAGLNCTIPATDLDLDQVRKLFETNVFGLMSMCSAFADLLIAASGLIVNIGSLSAVTPYVFASAYSASKAAVASYSRVLRLELKPFGVRVMVVMAGTVQSLITTKNVHALPPASLYQRVADLFRHRVTFSHTSRASITTTELARRTAAAALRLEVPLLLRPWLGRPDWFWTGGWSRLVWLGGILGEWSTDFVMYRMFGMRRLEWDLQRAAAVAAAAEPKKLT